MSGAPTGTGAPNGAGAPTGGATGTGGASGTGGATGTGPGKANGIPAMSESGAPAELHMAAMGEAAPTSPAVVWTHAEPPVISGAAATSGLSATATPHNPAAAATTLMLNRSKTLIDVDSFIRAQTPRIKWCSRTKCRTEVAVRRPRQLSAANVDHAPRLTAPFPNGDVRHGLTLVSAGKANSWRPTGSTRRSNRT